MAKDQESAQKNLITVHLKSPNENFSVNIEDDTSVVNFKGVVAQRFNVPSEQIYLIFAGRILKDYETLSHHKMKDGAIVHVVIKSAPAVESVPTGIIEEAPLGGFDSRDVLEMDSNISLDEQILLDPESLETFMDTINNPINRGAQEQMTQLLTGIIQQLEDLDTQSVLGNFEAVEELLEQIQAGVESLRSWLPELPNLFPETSPATTVSTATDNVTTGVTPGNVDTQAASSSSFGDILSEFIRQITALLEDASDTPEDKYHSQLEQLSAMGFDNKEDNIDALEVTNGDLDLAVQLLLESNVQQNPPSQ